MDEVETAWQKIKTNIIGAAEKALGKRKCNIKAKPNNTARFQEPRRCKLAVYNQSVSQVMQFKYLGVKIASNRNLEENVEDQTTKAFIIPGYLKDITWRKKHMSIKSKARIYKTCIRPIKTYAAETSAESTITERIRRTTEVRTLRAITETSLKDRRRNKEIRKESKTQCVVKWIKRRRREWRDHVERMNDSRLPKVAKTGKIGTTRPPGKPRRKWHESWISSSQDQQTP
ncbi:hypothetical protein M0804_013842 [Polistes exclamans]|nr:hypothetical protein M0804_013842 [Polistes exclamans]